MVAIVSGDPCLGQQALDQRRMTSSARRHRIPGLPFTHQRLSADWKPRRPRILAPICQRRPKYPVAPLSANPRDSLGRQAHLCRRAKLKRVTGPNNFPIARQLNALTDACVAGERCESCDPSMIQPHPGTCGNRRPENRERAHRLYFDRCGVHVEPAAAIQHAHADGTVDIGIHLTSPASRFARDAKQIGIDARRHPTKRRQDVMTHTIPRETRRLVRRIVRPEQRLLCGIRLDRASANTDERPNRASTRVQPSEPARARATHDSQKNRLELVILGVRGGYNRRPPEPGRCVTQKSPASSPQVFFGAKRRRGPPAHALDAQLGAPPSHQLHRLRRRISGSMIERRNKERHSRHSDGRIEQHHRIDAPRNGEHDAIMRRDGIANCCANRGSRVSGSHSENIAALIVAVSAEPLERRFRAGYTSGVLFTL